MRGANKNESKSLGIEEQRAALLSEASMPRQLDASEKVGTFLEAFGGSSDDTGADIHATSDGGFIIIGYTESYGAGGQDIIVMKFNANDLLFWALTIGTSNTDDGYGIIETSDGGFALTGSVSSDDAGQSNILICKISCNGDVEWSQEIAQSISSDYNYADFGKKIMEASDGGLVVVGHDSLYEKVILTKVSATGTPLWYKTLSMTSDMKDLQSYDVIETIDGHIVCLYSGTASGTKDDAIVAKFDSGGSLIWAKSLENAGGVASSLSGGAVEEGVNGDLWVLKGYQTTDVGDVSMYAALVAKLDASGSFLWAKFISSATGSIKPNSGRETDDGGFVLTGAGYAIKDESWGQDVFAVKLDGNGSFIWGKDIGGINYADNSKLDQAMGLVISSFGDILLTGYTTSFSIDGSKDVLVARLDSLGEIEGCSEDQIFMPTITDALSTVTVIDTTDLLTVSSSYPTFSTPSLSTSDITSNINQTIQCENFIPTTASPVMPTTVQAVDTTLAVTSTTTTRQALPKTTTTDRATTSEARITERPTTTKQSLPDTTTTDRATTSTKRQTTTTLEARITEQPTTTTEKQLPITTTRSQRPIWETTALPMVGVVTERGDDTTAGLSHGITDTHDKPGALVIGLVVGSIALIGAAVGVVYALLKRKMRKRRRSKSELTVTLSAMGDPDYHAGHVQLPVRDVWKAGSDRSLSGVELSLHRAAWAGQWERAQELIAKGADVNALDTRQWTPLHIAAQRGHGDLIGLLVDHGADIEALNNQGCTPLYLAVNCGYPKAMEVLLQHGANAFVLGPDGLSPFDLALRDGYKVVIDAVAKPPILRVWRGKKTPPSAYPGYRPVAAKTKGCAPGFIGETAAGKPCMIKLGWPDASDDVSDTLTTIRRQDHRRSEVGVVKEKIGADAYASLGFGHFYVPKHRLANLPLRNEYSMKHPDVQVLAARFDQGRNAKSETLVHKCVHLVSKWVDGYCDLNTLTDCLASKTDEQPMPFMAFLEQGMVPSFVRIEGVVVELKGLMELLAVSRLIGDTDVLGGSADNAGYVVERDGEGVPTAVRVVKIDAGQAFGFSDPKNQFLQSFLPSSSEETLTDKRDLQWGRNRPIQIEWNKLQSRQQGLFMGMLRKGLAIIRKTGFLTLLIQRRGLFDQARDGDKQLITARMIDQLKSSWLGYLKIQERSEVYGQALSVNSSDLEEDPSFNPKAFGVANYSMRAMEHLLEEDRVAAGTQM